MDHMDDWTKQQLLDSSGDSLASLQNFDLLHKFVVKDPLIGLPPQITWLKNIKRPANDNEYASKSLF